MKNKHLHKSYSFIAKLANYQGENIFNPYKDVCWEHDKDQTAPQKRQENLLEVLKFFEDNQCDALWVGLALGYKGGRNTGLAFTDEYNIGKASGVYKTQLLTTQKGHSLQKENTANCIWDILPDLQEKIFMWNAFPMHPHHKNKPNSNRNPISTEFQFGAECLKDLCRILQPKSLLAIGRDAYFLMKGRAYNQYPIDVVRHPSFGGVNIFKNFITMKYTTQLDLIF